MKQNCKWVNAAPLWFLNILPLRYYYHARSAAHYLDGQVGRDFVAVLEDDLQVDLEVDLAPEVFHAGAGVVPRQDHVHRNVDISSHVAIAYLNELDFSPFVERLALDVNSLHSQHLQVDGSDRRVSWVDGQPSAEIVVEEADLAVELSPNFEGGHFGLVALDVIRHHHKRFLFGILKVVDGLSSLFWHLNIEWCLRLQHASIVEDDDCIDGVANGYVHSNIALQKLVLPSLQFEPEWQFDLICQCLSLGDDDVP